MRQERGERCRFPQWRLRDLAPLLINNNIRISSKVPALPSSPLSQLIQLGLQWFNWEPAIVKLGGQGGLWGRVWVTLAPAGVCVGARGHSQGGQGGQARAASSGALAFQFCHGVPCVPLS